MEGKNIILFGCMGAGKDTIADYLANEYGYIKVKLGKYIHENCDKYDYKNLDKRKLMQDYGQMCRELFGIDVWNETLWGEIQNEYELYSELDGRELKFVIADGRQLNEFKYWKGKGFTSVGVCANRELRADRLYKRDGVNEAANFEHDTEKQALQCALKCDYVINNNGSLEEAVQAIKSIIEGDTK